MIKCFSIPAGNLIFNIYIKFYHYFVEAIAFFTTFAPTIDFFAKSKYLIIS